MCQDKTSATAYKDKNDDKIIYFFRSRLPPSFRRIFRIGFRFDVKLWKSALIPRTSTTSGRSPLASFFDVENSFIPISFLFPKLDVLFDQNETTFSRVTNHHPSCDNRHQPVRFRRSRRASEHPKNDAGEKQRERGASLRFPFVLSILVEARFVGIESASFESGPSFLRLRFPSSTDGFSFGLKSILPIKPSVSIG